MGAASGAAERGAGSGAAACAGDRVGEGLGTVGWVERTELTPLQMATLEVLRKSPEPLVFDQSLAAELREVALEAFDEFGERLGDRQVYMSKHRIATVLACEANAMAPDEFAWNPATATGQVSHRAIQLLVTWRGVPTPLELVDEAIARLADGDSGLGQWLAGLPPGEESDLRGSATERVTRFLEGFPPLDPRWHPMAEARVQWPLDGPVILAGKVDLVIGRPERDVSTKVIIDLKTGRKAPRHRDDLRFYALVETLRTGVPPRKLASYYLDVGVADAEDVTEGVLRAALRRTLDAIDVEVDLLTGAREPERRAGPTCRWCPLIDGCDVGQAHLEALADPDADPFSPWSPAFGN